MSRVGGRAARTCAGQSAWGKRGWVGAGVFGLMGCFVCLFFGWCDDDQGEEDGWTDGRTDGADGGCFWFSGFLVFGCWFIGSAVGDGNYVVWRRFWGGGGGGLLGCCFAWGRFVVSLERRGVCVREGEKVWGVPGTQVGAWRRKEYVAWSR